MTDMNVHDILEEKAKRVDTIIEKYIPREYTKESMEFTLGKPRFSHDTEAATAAISKPVWDLLDRGGKRWRPALFLMVCDALGDDSKKYEDLVVLFEVIHEGTLLIDDIEDKSDLRRGKKAVHKIFGEDVAINAGNAMYYLPLLTLLRNTDVDEKTMLRIYEIYAQEMINLSFGQAMDIAWHNSLADADRISENEYLQMCAYKTGTLARMAARIGAVVTGAPEDMVEKIGVLAESIGIGFQIQDDLLNLTATSDKNQFVKDYIGSDITEGKRTLMVIHAMNNADEQEKNRLLEILKKHTKEEKEISEAIDIMKKSGSTDYAKNFARDHVTQAWDDVKDLIPETRAKQELEAFIKFAIEREY